MQPHAERDRRWDQWPGRTPPDDRVRGRLRSLFGPTDDTDAIAELITMRGKELEERSARLRIAVGELEQREARARSLHARVEQILREGAEELDHRQSELSAQAAELDRREAAIAETEATIEERRRELGAVELRRAAVERREEALRVRDEELQSRARELADLARRLDEFGATLGGLEPRPARDDQYIALLAADRYRLVPIPGPVPDPGASIEVGDEVFRCIRVTVSPLPGDDRRCALLELVWPEAPQPDTA
jgi:hypothetical protein